MKTVKIEIQVPDWAKFIAQDENGQWNAFDKRPFHIIGRNGMHGYWNPITYSYESLFKTSKFNPNWKETLIKV
jgi:hypothetical protein